MRKLRLTEITWLVSTRSRRNPCAEPSHTDRAMFPKPWGPLNSKRETTWQKLTALTSNESPQAVRAIHLHLLPCGQLAVGQGFHPSPGPQFWGSLLPPLSKHLCSCNSRCPHTCRASLVKASLEPLDLPMARTGFLAPLNIF